MLYQLIPKTEPVSRHKLQCNGARIIDAYSEDGDLVQIYRTPADAYYRGPADARKQARQSLPARAPHRLITHNPTIPNRRTHTMTAKTIAVAGNKGGIGKTTSVYYLGQDFVDRGLSVLVIDADGQANLTAAYGITEEHLDARGDLSSLLEGTSKPLEPIFDAVGEPDMIAADKRYLDDVADEMATPSKIGWMFRLQSAIRTIGAEYDIILIDCPPNLGVLTYTALIAADYVLVPSQAEAWSIDGLWRIVEKIDTMQADMGFSPQILGNIATQVRIDTNQHKDGLARLRNAPRRIPHLGHIPLRNGVDARQHLAAAYHVIADEIAARISLPACEVAR